MTDTLIEAGREGTCAESNAAKSTAEAESLMLRQAIQGETQDERSPSQKCTGQDIKVVAGDTAATAGTAVAAVDSETVAATTEATADTGTAVANVTEAVTEDMVVAVVSPEVALRSPLFPKVKMPRCYLIISASRLSRIRDRSTSIRLNLVFSMVIGTPDLRLSEAFRANSKLHLEFIPPTLLRSSRQLNSTKFCLLMQVLAEKSEKSAFYLLCHSL
jgi:hypothetical protein